MALQGIGISLSTPAAACCLLPAPRCRITINHSYRYIMVRTRKAASTTLNDALESACGAAIKQGKECSQHDILTARALLPDDIGKDEVPSQEELEKVWSSYTVFTTMRNPFARAASGYMYLTSTWANTSGQCSAPTFQQFCEQPMLLGAMANSYQCR
jgi:hypothetical protein